MATLTYGTWLINLDSGVPTTAYDTSGKTEGIEYIHFNNSVKRTMSCQLDAGVIPNSAGFHYAIGTGSFTELFTIDDVANETDASLIEKFMMVNHSITQASLNYLVVVLNDTPTFRTFYRSYDGGVSSAAYLPCRLKDLNMSWDEKKQLYQVKVTVEACWPA